MDICIKSIDEEEWRIFRVESIKHGLKAGDFFAKIIQEHEASCKESNWNKVLFGEKTCKGLMTQEEGKRIRNTFRKEFTMRKNNELYH